MAAKRRYWGLIPPMPAVALAEVAKQSEAIGLEGIWGIQLYGPPRWPIRSLFVCRFTDLRRNKLASTARGSPGHFTCNTYCWS